jgi:hypothetical protein
MVTRGGMLASVKEEGWLAMATAVRGSAVAARQNREVPGVARASGEASRGSVKNPGQVVLEEAGQGEQALGGVPK